MKCSLFLNAAAAIFCGTSALASPPTIRTLEAETRIEVVAAPPAPGVADEDYLQVALIDETTGRVGAPIFGTYTRKSDQLIFRPRFALAPGARYRASAGGERIDHRVPLPEPSAGSTVTGISPDIAEVPANLLKFYIYFSRAMREGREVFESIHLLDENGQPVPAPWRDTELWTEDARRLTLWIHPGRVKRGVNLREEFGPVLKTSHRYTLVVGTALRDTAGQPLAGEFRHTFRTMAESHALLDLKDWKTEIPTVGTREPFRIIAPIPLDPIIARRSLHLHDQVGKEIEGLASLAADDRTWSFLPSVPWPSAPHQFSANPWLEDLAGNTFARIFDDDLEAARTAASPQMQRSFQPRQPSASQ